LLVAVTFVVPPSLKIFTAEYFLRIDQAGLHHYRIGDIPWPDVSGIRIGSVTVKGNTKYHLMVMIKRPDRYADRFGSWFMFVQRKTLQEKHTLAIPLQMANGNPVYVFEAAVRFRATVSPPAITGWDGNRDALAPLARWLQNNPLNVDRGKDAAYMTQRILNTMAASYGGWTHLDTPEMAAKRAEMKILTQAKFDLLTARENQALTSSPPQDVASAQQILGEATRNAEREFLQSADGRRLTELESQLQSQVATSARRERWQVAVALIVIFAIYIGLTLLRHSSH